MRSLTFVAGGVAALTLWACASASSDATQPIPPSWLSVEKTTQFRSISYSPEGVLLYVAPAPRTTPIHVARSSGGFQLFNGSRPLTPEFAAIDSFDVTADLKEVVFSARRKDSFDVGLVSADGSPVHWVPEDPADEISVSYAPQANKISTILRTVVGDLVRTVHIATAAALVNDFPFGRVNAIAWHPSGERYAVSWSSIDASDRVETMRYGGEQRTLAAPPAVQLDASVDAIGTVPVLRPNDLQYNEKVPLVVWLAGDPSRWEDARGALERNARVACAVVRAVPEPAFWAAAAEVPWVDPARLFVVGARGPAGVTSIVGDPELPAGRYREAGGIVSVPPPVVKSFAASYIALHLKGTSPDHGSHR